LLHNTANSRVSSNGSGSGTSTAKMTGSSPASRSTFLAASNQGDCARLLIGNELGSIPRLPANHAPLVQRQGAGFQPRQCGFESYAECQHVPYGRGLPPGLQNRIRRFDPATALQNRGSQATEAAGARCLRPAAGEGAAPAEPFNGDVSQQATAPHCDCGSDGRDTHTSPNLPAWPSGEAPSL
jgi:hypothetical protein